MSAAVRSNRSFRAPASSFSFTISRSRASISGASSGWGSASVSGAGFSAAAVCSGDFVSSAMLTGVRSFALRDGCHIGCPAPKIK